MRKQAFDAKKRGRYKKLRNKIENYTLSMGVHRKENLIIRNI